MTHRIDPVQRGVDGGTTRLNYGDPARAMTPKRSKACASCTRPISGFFETEEQADAHAETNAWRRMASSCSDVEVPQARFPAAVRVLTDLLAGLLSGHGLTGVAIPGPHPVYRIMPAIPGDIDIGGVVSQLGGTIQTVEPDFGGKWVCGAACAIRLGRRDVEHHAAFVDASDPRQRAADRAAAEREREERQAPTAPPASDDWATRRANETAHFAQQQAERDRALEARREGQQALVREREERIAAEPRPPERAALGGPNVPIRCRGGCETRSCPSVIRDDPSRFASWCQANGLLISADGSVACRTCRFRAAAIDRAPLPPPIPFADYAAHRSREAASRARNRSVVDDATAALVEGDAPAAATDPESPVEPPPDAGPAPVRPLRAKKGAK